MRASRVVLALLLFWALSFGSIVATDQFIQQAAAAPLAKGEHSPFHVWVKAGDPPLVVSQETAVDSAVSYALSVLDTMSTTEIGKRKKVAIATRADFEAAYKAVNPMAPLPVKGAHSPFQAWAVGSDQLLLAQESFRIACVDYGYAVIDSLSSTKIASRRAAVAPARSAFEAAYAASQVPANLPLPEIAGWTVTAEWESQRLVAQETFQTACMRYAEAVLNGAAAPDVEAAKETAAAARAALLTVASKEALPLRTDTPGLARVYWLPEDTNVFTAREAEYARLCVTAVESAIHSSTVMGRMKIEITDEADFQDALVVRAMLEGVTSTDETPGVALDTTDVMPPESVTLTAGAGAQPNPAPQPVSGHPLAPIFIGGNTFDDATGAMLPRALSIQWEPDTPADVVAEDGQEEFVLNYFEQMEFVLGPTPICAELSLDGGPWVSARYGRMKIPNLPLGDHQIRVVLWPTVGTNSIPLDPIVLKRLPDRSDGSPFWWLNPPYGIQYTPPPEVTFSASPTTIALGGKSTLSWTVTGATKVEIAPGIGEVGLSGSLQVSPPGATTYTLTARGVGSVNKTATISVQFPSGFEPEIPAGAAVLTAGTDAVTFLPNGTAVGPANPTPVPVAGHTMIAWDGTTRKSPGLKYGSAGFDFNLWDNTANGPVPMQVEFSLNGGPWVATRGTAYMPNGLPDGTYQVRAVSWAQAGNSTPWQPMFLKRVSGGGSVVWTWYQ